MKENPENKMAVSLVRDRLEVVDGVNSRTLCALAGHRPQQDLKWDRRNAWPIIRGIEKDAADRSIYTKSRRASPLQLGDWKLIQQQSEIELYHITDDEGETKNLAAENPQIVRQLLDLLKTDAEKWRSVRLA